MKSLSKVVAMILFLAFFCAPAMAAVDLSALTDDDLIRLRSELNAEIVERGLVASANVPTGEYVIGEDIPAGTYSISTDNGHLMIVLGEYEMVYTLEPQSPIGKLNLTDKMKFMTTGPITLTKYAGLSFE